MRFSRRKLELFVVVIVLICLGVWSVPRFLQSQRNLAEYYIQKDLDEVFKALRQYHLDHDNMLPPELVEENLAPWSAGQFGYTLHEANHRHVSEIVEVLEDKGYSKIMLSYLKEKYEGECWFFIVKKPGTNEIYNFAVQIPWIFSDQDSVGGFIQEHELLRLDYENQYDFKQSVTLIPQFYYHPSNGIESRGFIYQDLLGTKSTQDN